MSPLAYEYYNSDLVEKGDSRKEQKIAYHDDTVFLARGKNFEEASRMIIDMMTRENGALQMGQRTQLVIQN